MIVTTHNREETQVLAAKLAASLEHAERTAAAVITLRGDLGTGKTTFTQGLLKALGVEDSVTSPTFVLMQRYPLEKHGFTNAYHIDAYRLTKDTDLAALGLDTVLTDPANLLIVEWPEVGGDLFTPTMDIALEHGADSEERTFKITARS